MKTIKAIKEITDIYYKKDKRVWAQKVEDKIYVTDSYRVWVFKDEDFILDVDKFKNVEITNFFNEEGYETGIKTNELVDMEKFTGVYVTNEDKSIKALLNKKYLDVFENYTLKIKGEDKPILIYENDEVVGLVLPVRQY